MRRNILFILLGLFIVAGLAPARIAAPAYSLENGAIVQQSLLNLYDPAYINLDVTLAETGKDHVILQTRSVAALSRTLVSQPSMPTAGNAELVYTTYLQDSGWQSETQEGAISGGAALPLEAIQVRLTHLAEAGSVSYRTYRQDSGWSGYAKNGGTSGTTGAGEAIEAVQLKLTGALAAQYNLYYRVQTSRFGWLDWAGNGETAGTDGFRYPIEGVEIVLMNKEQTFLGKREQGFIKRTEPVLSYSSYLTDSGWQEPVLNPAQSGSPDSSQSLEGLQAKLDSQPYPGSVSYRAATSENGWFEWTQDGLEAGLPGTGQRIERIEMQLTDELAAHYDIYYQVHVPGVGWLDWAKNGETAGTQGYDYEVSAVQMQLVQKDGQAPGNTAVAFMKYVPKPPPVPVVPPVPTYPTGPDWTVQDGTFRTNAGTNYHVGSSYIIISIAYQRVWAYIGNQQIVNAPVITGRPSMPTPRGLFAIQPYKESPSVLVGEDYESPVQYWIPFLGNAYGLHDASWQTQGFGGDLYLYFGSHGCVNTPYYAVQTLYNTYSVGTPVVVY
ncbi:L,D-transpeptidase family protein [Trichococcus collinsii]|nr:L,D-transpeptidase family protein [Trichococcus collinsii]